MTYTLFWIAATALAQQVVLASVPANAPIPFSSNFHQPKPPLVVSEFKANWNQHKWNVNVSHIASGFIYSSPSNKKVRVDEAYDSVLGSSLFDYTNVTQQGVSNILWTLSPAVASPPEFYIGYASIPSFPLLTTDILVANNAVYAGVVEDQYAGEVVAWNIIYAAQVPATVLLDENNVVQGYNYWAPNERTYVITRFFNIITGKVPADVFEFPQPN